MTPWTLFFIYVVGAFVTYIWAALYHQYLLDTTSWPSRPSPEYAAETVVFVTIMWPLVILYLPVSGLAYFTRKLFRP